jgi:hypothetical protein
MDKHLPTRPVRRPIRPQRTSRLAAVALVSFALVTLLGMAGSTALRGASTGMPDVAASPPARTIPELPREWRTLAPPPSFDDMYGDHVPARNLDWIREGR